MKLPVYQAAVIWWAPPPLVEVEECESIPEAVPPVLVRSDDWYSFAPIADRVVHKDRGNFWTITGGESPWRWIKTPPFWSTIDELVDRYVFPWGVIDREIITLLCDRGGKSHDVSAATAVYDATHGADRFAFVDPPDAPLPQAPATTSTEPAASVEPGPAEVLVPIYESTELVVLCGELRRRTQVVAFEPIAEEVMFDELTDGWSRTTACPRPVYHVRVPEGRVAGDWFLYRDRKLTASIVRDWAASGFNGFALGPHSANPALVDRRRRAEPMWYPLGREPQPDPSVAPRQAVFAFD